MWCRQSLIPLSLAAVCVCGCGYSVGSGRMYLNAAGRREENGEVERTDGRRDCHYYQMWSATGVSHRCSCMDALLRTDDCEL